MNFLVRFGSFLLEANISLAAYFVGKRFVEKKLFFLKKKYIFAV